jgi:hypothetical protein
LMRLAAISLRGEEGTMGLTVKRWNQVRVAVLGAILGTAYIGTTILLWEGNTRP